MAYPDETLHEIITNAVLHRDYSIVTDIQIRIYDDRIEVHSPGRLPGHVTVENVLEEQFARNPKLVRLINKFPNPPNKDVGEGLNTAFQAMRKIRLQEPEVSETDQSVIKFVGPATRASRRRHRLWWSTSRPIPSSPIRSVAKSRVFAAMMKDAVALREAGLLEQVPGKRAAQPLGERRPRATARQGDPTSTEV